MTTKKISYNELKEAVQVAFEGDEEIFGLYDPNVKVSSINEVVENVYEKISEHYNQEFHSVYEGSELIGYFTNTKKCVISFGISKKYRVQQYLDDFFSIIKNEAGDSFFIFLWETNVRAIKWLIKNGLVKTFYHNNIIKLQCQ